MERMEQIHLNVLVLYIKSDYWRKYKGHSDTSRFCAKNGMLFLLNLVRLNGSTLESYIWRNLKSAVTCSYHANSSNKKKKTSKARFSLVILPKNKNKGEECFVYKKYTERSGVTYPIITSVLDCQVNHSTKNLFIFLFLSFLI